MAGRIVLFGATGYTGTLTVRMRRPTPLNRRLDCVGGCVPLPDRGSRRHGYHDVGELPAAGLPHA